MHFLTLSQNEEKMLLEQPLVIFPSFSEGIAGKYNLFLVFIFKRRMDHTRWQNRRI